MSRLNLGRRWVGDREQTYFIAEISANHDGDLGRAKDLIHLAAEAGADAAKFQTFRASTVASRYGYAQLGGQLSHQATWKKSVYQVYQDAMLPWEWTEILKDECDTAGVEFFSTPYDFDAVDLLDPVVAVFKIGSGDITWPEMLQKVAHKNKPVILSTGASDFSEVREAVLIIQGINPKLALLQCNTNYVPDSENFKHIHLNVLKTYRTVFPRVVLGLSDHAPGHAAVLGAVALGATIIEKHLTDDTSREGPDHAFSMTPATWREMVDRTRELELALGSADKYVADNEKETVIVQRRCLRASRDIEAGTVLTRDLIDVLRPVSWGAIFPYELEEVLGLCLRVDVLAGEHLYWAMFEYEH